MGDNGSAVKKYALLAGVILLAQAALAWLVIALVFEDRILWVDDDELLPPATERTAVRAPGRLPYYYVTSELQKIITNPADTDGQRFVSVSVQLGLVAYDRSKKPPDVDITHQLTADSKLIARIAPYHTRIRSIVVAVLRTKDMSALEGNAVDAVERDIRNKLNTELFERVFAITDRETRQLLVQEVVFSDFVVQ